MIVLGLLSLFGNETEPWASDLVYSIDLFGNEIEP
jgi:hypothetical protein